MDKLHCIHVFLEVARGMSFSRAAQRLGVAKGSVTKQVAWLERELGVQLLIRTTKSVALTESGMALLENAPELLERLEHLEDAVRGSLQAPTGMLRVGTPPSFGAFHLVPVISAFALAHPDVQVVMYLDDGRTNLVEEGLDMSIRIVPRLKDASHIARHLATAPQVLVAAPSYLQRRGRPRSLADLEGHDCMVHALKAPTGTWTFHGPAGSVSTRVRGTIRANFGEPLKRAALLGHGISMHPTYMVADDLQAGRLEVVLPQFRPTGLEVHAVFPSRRNVPVRLRTFLDFLKQWFRSPSWDS